MKATIKTSFRTKRSVTPVKKAVQAPPALADAHAAFRAKYPQEFTLADLGWSEDELKKTYNV